MFNFTIVLRLFVTALVATILVGCATSAQHKSTLSLYERLGAQPAIEAAVDEFVANVAADTRINRFFANADIARLKTLLAEQICAGSGGPCTYTGRDMKTAHAGMGVTNEHFSALVEDLVAALNKIKVPQAEQDELLGVLGTMQGDIVSG